MTIGLDAKRAFHNYSGLGNYSRLLIQSLLDLYKENQYYLYTPGYKPHPLHNFVNNENCKVISPNSIASLLPSSFWRSFLMSNKINHQNIDIFHGLSGELPFSTLKMPKVVTVHDLIFMRYPKYYTPFDRKMYEKKCKHACKVADTIITVSKQTADDCIHFLGADPRKIEIGYQSCDPQFFMPVNKSEILKKYDLPEKFILNIGTIEVRKNLLNLVKALKFIDDEIYLVAIGKKTSYYSQIEEYVKENHLAHRIRWMHHVPFCDFPGFYAAASVFVYPSVFEGFGIPVLEALAIGTPVATSNISSMPEVGGNAVLYFDPYNIEEIANTINLLLTDKETVTKLKEYRTAQLEKFSVKNITKHIHTIYHSI